MEIVKQKCLRLMQNIQNNKMAIQDLIENNPRFIKKFRDAVKQECSAKLTIKTNKKLKKYYIKQGYKIMSRENIYKSVVKLLK